VFDFCAQMLRQFSQRLQTGKLLALRIEILWRKPALEGST
jgi:hypothetical protein